MLLVKPSQISLLTRPIEYKKRFGLSVSACLHVPIDQGNKGALWGEQSLWKFVSSREYPPVLDEGVTKLIPEFLVSGYAYSTADRANAVAVKIKLGTKEKTVLVFGERYWKASQSMSEPTPFSKLPLIWDNAFGGLNFDANLFGKGMQPTESGHWLPNLELPSDRLRSASQKISPAGFGPIDVSHPQRIQHRGTYDESYLKEHSPGFPPDLDWRYFNMAPKDQWLDAPLVGDEPFELHNMHSTRAIQKGNLPALRVRLFSQFESDVSNNDLREVPLRLTTVWFFPDAERYILIFHGLMEVDTDDGSDVKKLVSAVERISEPRSKDHYLNVVKLRDDADFGAIHFLNDSDLLPAGINTVDPDTEESKKPFAMDGLQTDAQYLRATLEVEAARERAASIGKNPDALGIKMPEREKLPEGPELVAYLKKQMQENQAQQLHALNDTLAQLEAALIFAEKNKIDLGDLQHRGPPTYTATAHLNQLKATSGNAKINEKVAISTFVLKEEAERDAYLQGAHYQAAAKPMDPLKSRSLKAEICAAMASGLKTFIGIELTGGDLSHLDLRGFDFSDAWLESVDFSNSNLSGSNFSKAVLAHSNFSNVIAIGSNFSKANLGAAVLLNAVFDGSDFSDATLMHCNFASTQLPGAEVARALLLESIWGKADWSSVKAIGQTFYKADMKGMVFAEANFSGANFLECDLSGVDFRAATLTSTTFVGCNLNDSDLKGVNALGAVFVKGCSLVGADLSQGNFVSVNFGASDMSSAKLVRAVCDNANFAEVNLTSCDCRLSTMKSALFRKTIARNSLLAGVNFENAVLQHADLRGADMRNSNLFAADLSRVRLDGDLKLDGANLKRTRTWPRLSQDQQAVST
jgi:uncharacterized protein YjbI with pentapeptide repeats